jgi:hypothetical protein
MIMAHQPMHTTIGKNNILLWLFLMNIGDCPQSGRLRFEPNIWWRQLGLQPHIMASLLVKIHNRLGE